MSKLTRKQKKEEEKRILEEMRKALAEADAEDKEETGACANVEEDKPCSPARNFGEMPEVLHCKRCKTQMKNGVCPVCGYRIYIPMDEQKRNKIKNTLTYVLMIAFLIVFIFLQATKS